MSSFLITKKLEIEELKSTLTELVHEPTGARVMHIGNEDPENLFCLSFQTLPFSSNGVAHILEHTVLCGSQKFPVKDPFFSMTRRSLHTFMNALTGQDFTCYPASSQVKKDFYNLLDVYLDAVFHPLLKKESFYQEGHRLEPTGIHGIVYNEMKGAMSSPDSRLWQAVMKHLLPDLPYAFNSGGDPKDIPLLSYEELLEFHKTFYHPSRCLFFFYGNMPLTSHLKFIEEKALKGVSKEPLLPPLKLQQRLSGPLHFKTPYPTDAVKEKTIISFAFLTAHLSHSHEVLALSLLELILLETDASPLKMALLKSGLCKEVESILDVEMSEVPFLINCSGCEETSVESLKTILFETLSEPIDPKLIEAALHQLELQRTEIGGDGGPFGLTLFMRAALLKQHGTEPEEGLMIHRQFGELRDRLKDPLFLPSMIRKYFLENPHFVTELLVPDLHLAKKEKEEEKKLFHHLKERKPFEKLSPEAPENIDSLPKVTLRDIPKKTKDFPLQKLPGNTYFHSCFTNQMIYADFLFDLPKVENLSLLSLLGSIWTELGCAGQSYEETLQEMQAHTGGIGANLALHVNSQSPDMMNPSFSIRGKALSRKKKEFFSLLTDFAKGPDFSDRARMKSWLLQHASELENALPDNALRYATGLALKGNSQGAFVHNEWNGFSYYQFVQNCLKNESWMNELEPLADQLCRGKPTLIVSAEKAIDPFPWKVKPSSSPWQNIPIPTSKSHVRIIPSPVAFTARGFRVQPDSAPLLLATKLMNSVVLHKEIREKGGAYGGGASYSPLSANFHFFSYRDPNLSKTLSAFDLAIETIGAGDFSDQQFEEAKISTISAMDSPVAPGERANVAYAWLRADRPLKARQAFRNKLLSATKEEIAQAVQQNLHNAPSTTVSFLGQELWKKEQTKVDLQLIKDL